jgi:hypothetical protein
MRKTSGVPGERPRSLTRSPASLTRFFENWVETLEDQAQLNRRTMQGLTQLVREQREVFHELSHESLDAYDGFVDSLSSYYKEVAEDPED